MGRKRPGVSVRSQAGIEITFQYRGRRCRETLALKPTPTNLTRAERHRAAILLAIEDGTFDYAVTFPNSSNAELFATVPGDVLTVEKYLDKWLAQQKHHLRASTIEGYTKIINNYLIPEFGAYRLSHIKRRDIKSWLDPLSVSNKTLANLQSVLRKALSDAVDDDLIYDNPLANWSYRKTEPPKDRDVIDPFTLEEQKAIIDKSPELFANQIQFCFWTGVRTSELVALDWSDVDFKRGVVIIDKAMTQAAKGKAEGTKTKSGVREIKLLAPALQALRAQKAHTYIAGGPVFVHPVNRERWNGDQAIRKYWASLLKRAEVRYRRPYQTRHTYASMMLSAGEHPMWVAQQMGHSDWSMIIRIYGKWMPEADTLTGSKAEAKFTSKVVA